MCRHQPLASWWWTLIGCAEEVVAGMRRWWAGGLNTQPERKRHMKHCKHDSMFRSNTK